MINRLKTWLNAAERQPLDKTYLYLFGGALLFRLYSALLFQQPGYTDGYYYSNIANSLWQGRGFREDFIWNYLSRPLPDSLLNNPGSVYWFPLTSVLIFFGYTVAGGPSFFASQLLNILLSSTFPLLGYYLATDIFGKNPPGRRYGLLSALLLIFCSMYAPYFTLPDNFAPFAFFTFLGLLFNYKALRLAPSASHQKRANLLLAAMGVCTGLAYLTRVDGLILLMVAFGGFWLYRYLFRQPTALGWQSLGWLVATFCLTVAPWFIHNAVATGQFFPGGGTKTLFWREYNDFFTYAKTIDLPYYLNLSQPDPAWGWGPLLQSKLSALLENLWLIGRGALFLFPLFFWGLFSRSKTAESTQAAAPDSPQPDTPASQTLPVRLWQRPEFLPFALYTLLLYLAMSLAFTFPSTRGSVFHSSGGLLPFIYLVSFCGLDRFLIWLGTLSRPKAFRARQRSYSIFIVVGFMLVATGFPFALLGEWNRDYTENKAVGDWMRQNAPQAYIMVPDAPGFYYVNKTPCLASTSDAPEVNLELARRYGVKYFMLQPNHLPPSLIPLYNTRSAPGYTFLTQLGEVQIYRLE